MKQGNIKKWTDVSSCKNLLFFAELVNELLFDYSIPSNRISTLNSHYLCIDAINAINSIEESSAPEGNLKPIIEELYSSLDKDVLFKRKGENPLNYFVKYNDKQREYQLTKRPHELSYEEGRAIVSAINMRYFKNDWYLESLMNEIKTIVLENQESEWIDLFRLTKSLLTEVVNYGYDPRFIWIQTNRLFYSDGTIDSPSRINDFLSVFDCKQHKYKVIAKLNKNYKKLPHSGKMVKFLNECECRTKSKKEKEFLTCDENECFATLGREALDQFSAVSFCKNYFDRNAALYRMYDHDLDLSIRSIQWAVYDENDRFYLVENEKNLVKKVRMPDKEKLLSNLMRSLRAMDNALVQNNISDIVALNNALRFHWLSLDSESTQNQLLDLWAIFETLLDIKNKHTSDRIQQVCFFLVPILKRKYLYSLFSQLAFDIKNFSATWYKRIVKGSKSYDECVLHLCSFILLDDRQTEYKDFIDYCKDFPLLVERVNYYRNKLSSPKNVYDYVEKHSKRVRWQIMRIYRNRNLIIHNAKSMPYLNLLIENLHSYIDDFLEYTVQSLADGNTLASMNRALFSRECEWMEQFQRGKEKKLNEDKIRKCFLNYRESNIEAAIPAASNTCIQLSATVQIYRQTR